MRYVPAFVLLASAALFLGGAFAGCPTPIAAQRDIIADSYYDDPPVYSHIDPVKHAAYEAAVKPLDNYLRTVAQLASDGQKTCAMRWLVSWAEGDAMLGRIEKEQAHYERKWILAGLALSYAKVRDGASSDQRAAVDAWLQAVADSVRSHSDAFKGVRNNHYYWEGLAVAASGAVTGNAKDLAWGRKVYHEAMADIAPDGTLPPEMRRGGRALHYHLFSAAPLAMLESIVDENDPKFVKLAEFCRAAVANTDLAAKQAGVAQIGILDDDADWVAIYLRRHPSAAVNATRTPYVDRLGGDVSHANPLEHPAK